MSSLYDALELGVYWVTKDDERLRETLRRLSWEQLPPTDWCRNLHLALTLDNQPSAQAVSRIERSFAAEATIDAAEAPEEADAFHRANRLRLLGFFFFERGELEKGLAYFRSAARSLSGDRTLDARLKRIEIYGHWGKAAFREGKLGASEAYLEKAVRLAARLRHQIWYDTYRLELSYVYSHQGDAKRAERVARGVARRQSARKAPNGFHRFLLLRSLLVAGHCAVDAQDRVKGLRYARRAARAHRRHPIPRLEGYLHLLRGRVETLRGQGQSSRRAQAAFDKAEALFRHQGEGDLPGLMRLSVYRGDFYVASGDLSGALEESVSCLELARRHGFFPARAAGLLLKSQLLLQHKVPWADRLYEDVLRNLGAIHDNVVLFRVVANLYLYSWTLDDRQLDLTDWHLNQIHQMQNLLRPQTFHRLYESYVTRPVARRMLARTFGIDPDTL